jgi:hypothetical protein
MLTFVFLPALSGNSHCSVLVPPINTVLLLGAPVLPTWRWAKISTYLHVELFLLITSIVLIVHRMNYYYYVIITIATVMILLFSIIIIIIIIIIVICFLVIMIFLQYSLVSTLCCVCKWPCSCRLGT